MAESCLNTDNQIMRGLEMNTQQKQNRLIVVLFAGIIIACIIVAAILQIPKWRVYREVRTYAQELPVRMEYTLPEKLDTTKEKLMALKGLVEWEEESRVAINDAFDRNEEDPDEEERENDPWFFESRDVFYESARKKQWKRMRLTLKENAVQAIEELFEKAKQIPGVSKEEVKRSLQKGRFKTTIKIMDLAEKGDYHSAYTCACKGTQSDGGDLYRALVFGLYPDQMKKECEKELQDDLKDHGDRVYLLAADVLWMEVCISKPFGIKIDGLDEAREKVDRMEEKERAKSRAASKKLSSNNASSSNSSTKKNSYRPSSSLRDFDSYDIEAYYDDNRDEYDDYDDAYEGFMDDDSVWDDY